MAVIAKDGSSDQIRAAEKVRSIRARDCRSYMRKTLAAEFKGIVDGFVDAAKKGSCPHIKLAIELLQPARKSPSKKKGPVERYWEQLEKEQLENHGAEKASVQAG